MPDISMCGKENCPLKHTCYRFTAPPSGAWQVYGDFKPDVDGNCAFYWRITAEQPEKTKTYEKRPTD